MFVVSPWYDIFCRLRSSFRTPRLNYPVFLNFPEFGNDRKCILWISRFLPRHRRHRHSSTSSLYNIYQWLMTLHSLFLPHYPALSCQILRKCKLHFKNISLNFWSEKTICQSADKCYPHNDHISSHHAWPQILVITITEPLLCMMKNGECKRPSSTWRYVWEPGTAPATQHFICKIPQTSLKIFSPGEAGGRGSTSCFV